jgi:hypothetical protein
MITEEDARVITESVIKCKELAGNIAEVGVSIGDSAETICKVKGDKKFYLFDTFEGHPDVFVPGIDASSQLPGKHKAEIEQVKERLKEYPNLEFIKGKVPDTLKGFEDMKFCYVNIDTDLYISTFYALDFFFPRVVDGGIITIHDYPGISGVKQSVDYFCQNYPNKPIQLANQVIKIQK